MQLFLCLLLFSLNAFAYDVTLASDISVSEQVAGYRVYYGQASGDYALDVDVPGRMTTLATISDLPEGTWYFALKAYDSDGNFSVFSKEVFATLAEEPPPPTLDTLFITPNTVTSGDTAEGTVFLTDGGALVLLSSSNSSVAAVPSSVLIEENVASSTFPIETFAVQSTTGLR